MAWLGARNESRQFVAAGLDSEHHDSRYTFAGLYCRGKQMLAIQLPAEIEKRLDALAKATGRTKSFFAREAILEHLTDLEDLYLAEQRLTDIRSGKTKTAPLEEVMKQYGMEG